MLLDYYRAVWQCGMPPFQHLSSHELQSLRTSRGFVSFRIGVQLSKAAHIASQLNVISPLNNAKKC